MEPFTDFKKMFQWIAKVLQQCEESYLDIRYNNTDIYAGETFHDGTIMLYTVPNTQHSRRLLLDRVNAFITGEGQSYEHEYDVLVDCAIVLKEALKDSGKTYKMRANL